MLPKVPSTKYLALFILILLPSMTGYMAWEARTVDVTVLEIEGAPEGIIYITDPHVRASNIDHVQMVIREVNRLNPSLVLIGGDFATGDETGFASQSVWRSLDAPAYAVLGNHDYRVGTDAPTGLERLFAVRTSADVTAAGYDLSALKDGSADTAFADGLTATLEENGVHVLRNEYARISAGDGEVVIVGVDDGWAGMADPPDVPATDAFTVYLIHEPSCRADWDADLILAGHTHGGQFLFPVIDQLNDHGVVELAGMFDTNGTPTYVSRGVCSASFAGVDLRFNCRPEIVLINPTEEQLQVIGGST
ncbi:metallophosphoesterase [Methanoculleus bourgensis MS2]|uniref:Metallophosphoesterase n=2 Tax=Methanoculleus bourgensis TaxID=83986 RepID=I7L1H2_METBM|nr:metallophosphoesterase [Methanoculleus bourgensis]CCJ37440.1 metallophosphoesterase [Methanoculleus bourgensis MS2]